MDSHQSPSETLATSSHQHKSRTQRETGPACRSGSRDTPAARDTFCSDRRSYTTSPSWIHNQERFPTPRLSSHSSSWSDYSFPSPDPFRTSLKRAAYSISERFGYYHGSRRQSNLNLLMQKDLTAATGNHTAGTCSVSEKFSFSRILTVGNPWSTSVVCQQAGPISKLQSEPSSSWLLLLASPVFGGQVACLQWEKAWLSLDPHCSAWDFVCCREICQSTLPPQSLWFGGKVSLQCDVTL